MHGQLWGSQAYRVHDQPSTKHVQVPRRNGCYYLVPHCDTTNKLDLLSIRSPFQRAVNEAGDVVFRPSTFSRVCSMWCLGQCSHSISLSAMVLFTCSPTTVTPLRYNTPFLVHVSGLSASFVCPFLSCSVPVAFSFRRLCLL